MSHSHSAPAPDVFDESDPHGQHYVGQHESHVIVGPTVLRTVLLFLLIFTVLTVAIANAEVAIEHWLNIALPWWVNVVGAMSIAVVKTLLVMAFFMQLKYDNPINSVVMLFCFFALGLFLLFSGLDLFTRNWIYDYKSGPVVVGGSGAGVKGADGKPITVAAADRFKQLIGNPEVKEHLIVADAVRAFAEEAAKKGEAGASAAAELEAHADHMTDLHTLKSHPPAHDSHAQVVTARELSTLADELRAKGKGAQADIVADAARHVSALHISELTASFSVEEHFAHLAAQAHGGHGGHAAPAASTADASRAKTGRTDALNAEGGGTGHGAAAHEGL